MIAPAECRRIAPTASESSPEQRDVEADADRRASHSLPVGSGAVQHAPRSRSADERDANADVTTKATRKKTIALAVSTRCALGQAVNVVRIMPVPYSEAISARRA